MTQLSTALSYLLKISLVALQLFVFIAQIETQPAYATGQPVYPWITQWGCSGSDPYITVAWNKRSEYSNYKLTRSSSSTNYTTNDYLYTFDNKEGASKLVKNTSYSFTVTGLDSGGNAASAPEMVSVTTENCGAIPGIIYSYDNACTRDDYNSPAYPQVTINWSLSVTPAVKSYNIYRAEAGSSPTKVRNQDVSYLAAFIDTKSNNKIDNVSSLKDNLDYTYHVDAVGSDGGTLSSTAALTIKTPQCSNASSSTTAAATASPTQTANNSPTTQPTQKPTSKPVAKVNASVSPTPSPAGGAAPGEQQMSTFNPEGTTPTPSQTLVQSFISEKLPSVVFGIIALAGGGWFGVKYYLKRKAQKGSQSRTGDENPT